MSNKRYRTPPPQVDLRAIEAAMRGEGAAVPSDAEMLANAKRFLNKIVAAAEDALVGAQTLVSVREGMQAARTLLGIIKHEQRQHELAHRAAERAARMRPPHGQDRPTPRQSVRELAEANQGVIAAAVHQAEQSRATAPPVAA